MNLAIFDSLLEAVLVINSNGGLSYGNATASLLFEVSQKRLASGKPFGDIITFSEQSGLSADALKQLTSPSNYIETKFTAKTGKQGLVQYSVQPLENDQFLIFFRDVTLEETLQLKYRAELSQKEVYIAELEKARAELEQYSKNLEQMVQERTAELRSANQLMKAMLDSLGEGFVVFDQKGNCLPIFSKVCEDLIESKPAGEPIDKVLRISKEEAETFKFWCENLFDEPIPFEDLKPLGPNLYPHSKGRRVELDFAAMRGEGGKIEGVVMIAADRTSEFEARQEALRERAHVQVILKVVKNRSQFVRFLDEAQRILHLIDSEIKKPKPDWTLLAHHLHTLKGGAGTFSLKQIHDRSHATEDVLVELRKTEDLTMQKKLLEQVVQGCQNLQTDLEAFKKDHAQLFAGASTDGEKRVEVEVSRLVKWSMNQATASLTQEIMDAACEPIEGLLSHYSDLIQDVAASQEKRINPLQFKNGNLRIFSKPYEEVFSSLIHIFRNAIDHGLETPEERIAYKKSAEGTMSVTFTQKDRVIEIRIKDDGRGINPTIIRNKLKTLNYDAKVYEGESDAEVIQHVFDDQFSTRSEVTTMSGRGVGLSAVQGAVKTLGGEVRVTSVVGSGSEFVIKLPVLTAMDMQRQAESKSA